MATQTCVAFMSLGSKYSTCYARTHIFSDDTGTRSNPLKREKALVITSPHLDIIAERSEKDYSIGTPAVTPGSQGRSRRKYSDDQSGDMTPVSQDSYRSSTISISL